ncbi:peptidase T [Rubinisphaera sp.]|uniref:peptidase T n=1 Tax=Rubinisphaera sp. TaxID=2024857 RepID=UPI000C0DFCEF|nr:peptidase T [Rubinisphaera sp.]MBV10564.1 peptidase T [Rubinisphaera sp.]HCS52089.1 peptidase T [Planctomycetaceae bacterium]|tara:strand:+ start:13477 stop:14715 length:1239 start_codon:yes stop_codon:yes gene_type:complete
MPTLLERFLTYVCIDTQSDETSPSAPSTEKQLDLSRLLEKECRELGLEDVSLSPHGIVLATLPSNISEKVPTIAWVAHVDTSPEYSGTNVNPIVHEEYDGEDIVLPGDPSKVLKVSENPELSQLVGESIITTDGTTLLGADDKSGIAVIMAAVEYLLQHPEIPHGPIRVCFTVDEEIGRGIENMDFEALDSVCAYTLDSDGRGRIDSETFSADQATIIVMGINTHPSVGKGAMVNAIRILSAFIDRMPQLTLSPETTDGREGFMHPYHISGGVAEASARIILRDFETENLNAQAKLLESIAESLRSEYPKAEIEVQIKEQYRNMRDGLEKEPRALPFAIEATAAAGLEPHQDIIRGGTDGSLMTAAGLPTPNLSSGQHNPHSPLEWTSEIEMESAKMVLVELARRWGQERLS